MKKAILILISFSLLVGCDLGNTPTSRVEELLSNYQMLKNNIPISYEDLTADSNLDKNIKTRYVDVIKKQYQDLSYEVKDEEIDGNIATVTIQIEVMNYKESIGKYNEDDYESSKYHELVLEDLENTKEMITYTLEISLTKDKNNTWIVDDLTTENKAKLLGIY